MRLDDTDRRRPGAGAPLDAEGPASESAETARHPAGVLRRRPLSIIGTIASLLLFSASLFVLYRIVAEVSLDSLKNAFAEASRAQILSALVFTVVSYGLLTGYDALALRQLRLKIPYRTTALASFTSYAISFTLGFPLLTAGAVRYWVYAPRGLSAGKVASLTLIAGVSFWLGMGLIIGLGLITHASELAAVNRLSVEHNRVIGALVAGATLGYLLWVGAKTRVVKMQQWRLELPDLPVSLGQLALGVGDVSAACAVLFVLLPAGHGIDFPTFAAVYSFACLLGIASHAPGGLGVFEATMLLAFMQVPAEQMLSALLLFRILYYLVPFALAMALLGAYEIHRRLRAYRERALMEDNAGE